MLYGVAQCVVGVVRDVGADQHVRQFLQPQQVFVFNRFVAVVSVENPLFTFDNIQCRTAEPAAFYFCKKGISVKKGAASGVDNDGAVFSCWIRRRSRR